MRSCPLVGRGEDCTLDGFLESSLLARPVAVPARTPDAMESPSEADQNLLSQPVTVSRHARRVIHGSVAFDAQREVPWPLRVPDRHIDSVARRSDLRDDLVAPGANRAEDRLLKWALGLSTFVERVVDRQCRGTAGRELKIATQFIDTAVAAAAGQALRSERADDLDCTHG